MDTFSNARSFGANSDLKKIFGVARTCGPYPLSMRPMRRVRPVGVWDAQGLCSARVVRADESLPQVVRVREWVEAVRFVLGPVSVPDVVVRYGEGVPNAFLLNNRLVLGMGDGVVTGDFSRSLSVFAHEVGHWTGPRLYYRGEPGAVSEHLADVVAAQVMRGYRGIGSWRIGSSLFLDGVSCLRDMEFPGSAFGPGPLGCDVQVDHMSRTVWGEENRGGVHHNAGVLNRVFTYFASVVGDEVAFLVWGRARGRVGQFVGFEGFARITAAEAARVGVWAVCAEAWALVGIVL